MKKSVKKSAKSAKSALAVNSLATRRSGTKSKKVSKDDSTYRLFIQFLPAFVMPKEKMSYYSNTRFSDEYELQGLLRRVLHGSCFGKYKLAMLFHQPTGQCLSVWVPGQPEMSYENYKVFKSRNTPHTKSLLTALVIYKRDYRGQIMREHAGLPTYIYSSDYDPLKQQKGFDIALKSLLLKLTEGKFKGCFKSVVIYHGKGKQELGRISAEGHVTCKDADFRNKIHNSSRFRLPDLGVYVTS